MCKERRPYVWKQKMLPSLAHAHVSETLCFTRPAHYALPSSRYRATSTSMVLKLHCTRRRSRELHPGDNGHDNGCRGVNGPKTAQHGRRWSLNCTTQETMEREGIPQPAMMRYAHVHLIHRRVHVHSMHHRVGLSHGREERDERWRRGGYNLFTSFVMEQHIG